MSAPGCWEISTEGASKTKVLSLDGVPIARFYAGRADAETLAQIEAALNASETREPIASADWIDWAGGPCPVDPETLVEVRFSDGKFAKGKKAGFWVGRLSWWEHRSTEREHDIVAYRVVQS